MELKSVDAALLQKAVLAAAKGLEAKKEWINELNVFPVPDGDIIKSEERFCLANDTNENIIVWSQKYKESLSLE